jgi:hypothetical protein
MIIVNTLYKYRKRPLHTNSNKIIKEKHKNNSTNKSSFFSSNILPKIVFF